MQVDKEALCRNFESILTDSSKNENDIQAFLENNSEMIPLPFLLNHRLHFNSVLTKFPISTSLTTDFLYITKSSDSWWVVLVELENQHKKIFTTSRNKVHFSQEFNYAYDQIASWRSYINQNPREVKELLVKLFEPIRMARNPVHFKYVLVLGRNSEKRTEEHVHMFDQKNTNDIKVITYDTVMSSFNYAPYPEKHVILSKNGTSFKAKHLQDAEVPLFSIFTPAELELRQEQIVHLQNQGYDMDAWQKGEYLTINNKIPKSKETEFLRSLRSTPKPNP